MCTPVLRLCSIRFVLVSFVFSSGYVRFRFLCPGLVLVLVLCSVCAPAHVVLVLVLFMFLFSVPFALLCTLSGLVLVLDRCSVCAPAHVFLVLFLSLIFVVGVVVVGAVVHGVDPCLSLLALLRAVL